jgi:hypothetical protein
MIFMSGKKSTIHFFLSLCLFCLFSGEKRHCPLKRKALSALGGNLCNSSSPKDCGADRVEEKEETSPF